MKNSVTIFLVCLFLMILATSAWAWAQPGRWSGNKGNTYGWQMMTPEERSEHQAKMRSLQTMDACREYVDAHHKKMEERAVQKGITLQKFRRDPCERMKAKGWIK